MDEMIKAQQSLQREEMAWVSNLYRQRLKNLQETEVQHQGWLKSQDAVKE